MDEVGVFEHPEMTGPCNNCKKKWPDATVGHVLVLNILSDHEGVVECNSRLDLTIYLSDL